MNIWIYWVSGHVDYEKNVTRQRVEALLRSKSIEKIEIEK